MANTLTTRATSVDPLLWIRSNLVGGSAIAVSAQNRRPYPEVTGYLIPNLLQLGETRLARRFAAFLVANQRADGAFCGPDDGAAYAFDTGQALRGLLAFADIPQCRAAAQRAADWLCRTASADGRLALPSDLSAWDLGPRGRIPEAVHLYALPALVQAADVLDAPRYRQLALRARDAYLRDRAALQFDRPNMLSHFFGYVHEALIDLDAAEVAEQAVSAWLRHLRDDGSLPAYHDVSWVCLPGQLQAAIVLEKLGHESAARMALAFAESTQHENGGFPGSVGDGAAYFASDEPSWAVKFWLDAQTLVRGIAAPAHERAPDAPLPTDRNLAPEQWHESIRSGQQATDIAARIRGATPPAWLNALLETSETGDACLELGSGTGELSAWLAKHGRSVQLLDFSPQSLTLSRELFRLIGQDATFVQGDVTGRLPCEDRSVDVVWSSGLLEHFEPAVVDHIVAESARVARRRVVALVPNARSVAYRVGKQRQEQTGEWTWGREQPFASLRDVFERAGLVDVREWTVAPEHALEFLTAPALQPMRRQLARFYAGLSDVELRALDQGYLLVTVGSIASTPAPPPPPAAPRTTRRLAVLPNDPLDAYPAAGYPDLTGYFNPAGAFDEVYCLSPHESREKRMYGMRVVPVTAEELPRRIAELGIDVVRAYCLPAGQFACRDKVDGVRYVVSVHDSHPDRCPGPLPAADQFLAVSGSVEQFLLAKGADPANVRRLPNRVDLDVFRPVVDADKKAAWQKRFLGRHRVLHVGRRTEAKNLETLIRSLGRLGPDYVGILVGRGDNTRYRALADEVGACCHFVDAVPNAELAQWYSFADVVCNPSLWEGFGVVFIEALACGALVVTSDLAPMNEFITHEQTGLLVADHRDPTALATTLERAVTDTELCGRLRSAARGAAQPFGKQAVDHLERQIYVSHCDDVQAAREAAQHAPSLQSAPHPPAISRDLPTDVRLHLRHPDLRAAWDEIASTSPDAWMFHLDDWQQCQLQAFPLQDLSFAIEQQGHLVAICPVQRNVHDEDELRSTFMGTGGPAIAADVPAEQRGELLRIAHGMIARFLRDGLGKVVRVALPQLSMSSRAHWPSFANPLVAHGYRLGSTQTSLIDLTASEDELFTRLRARHRYSIRKASRLGAELVRLEGREGMDAYYRLHVETYTRTGVPPHPKSYFDAIADWMVARGHAETLALRLDGELVAAANVASYGDGSLYWTGAYSQRGLDTELGKLLQWEIIKASKAAGRRFYETGEVFPDAPPGSKERGLTTYKAGFGGVLRPWFKGSLHLEDLDS